MIKLPYLKSFSVNGLKHRIIECTCGGEGEGGLLSHFHIYSWISLFFLPTFLMHGENSKEKQVAENILLIRGWLSFVSPNFRSLYLYRFYRHFKSLGHFSDTGKISKIILMLSAPTYLIRLSFFFFFFAFACHRISSSENWKHGSLPLSQTDTHGKCTLQALKDPNIDDLVPQNQHTHARSLLPCFIINASSVENCYMSKTLEIN